MENAVNIKINGFDYQVPAGSTILEAARMVGIEIPTLCYLKEINAIGACRICVVEVKGARSLVAACVFPVNEGMEIFTNTPKVIQARKTTLELILSTHKKECLSCVRSGSCELQKLCKDYGIEDENAYAGDVVKYDIDASATHMYRDNEKCTGSDFRNRRPSLYPDGDPVYGRHRNTGLQLFGLRQRQRHFVHCRPPFGSGFRCGRGYRSQGGEHCPAERGL